MSRSDKRDLPEWLTTILGLALEKAGNVTALAKRISVPRSTVNGWTEGSSPHACDIESLVQFVNGDISRVLPTYQPSRSETSLVAEEPATYGPPTKELEMHRIGSVPSGGVVYWVASDNGIAAHSKPASNAAAPPRR